MGSGDDGYDVIVVGCGIAGLSAAVSAQQAGARAARVTVNRTARRLMEGRVLIPAHHPASESGTD